MKKKVGILLVFLLVLIFLLIFFNRSKIINNNTSKKKPDIKEEKNKKEIVKDKREDSKTIPEINNFYNKNITRDKDIRNLPSDYNYDDAIKDGCFYVGAMLKNEDLYNEFINNYRNNKSSYIRICNSTKDGDLIINDLLFDKGSQSFYLIHDNTRDKMSEDKKISYRKYLNMSNYTYKDRLYWILFNEKVDDNNFNTDNVFVLARIN